MNNGLTDALLIVISYLDEEMVKTPSKELADVSNFLEKELAKLSKED